MIYLARHDPLTGLINRREFEKRLQHCLATASDEGRLHALFYLDLDEFKVVNDTCGHLAGDEMLKQVTALLRSRLRKRIQLEWRSGKTLRRVAVDGTPVEPPTDDPLSASELLSSQLDVYGRDPIYEAAVRAGTR